MNTDAVQSVNVASLHAGMLPDGQYANWRTGLQPNIENINNYYHSKHVMHLVCSLSCCLHQVTAVFGASYTMKSITHLTPA